MCVRLVCNNLSVTENANASDSLSTQPTARFTDRVENYVKARPGYPAELIPYLELECGLSLGSVVLDVGSGTGLLAERLCEFGCRVIGVEPNAAMRAAGAQYLARFRNFTMREGTAESLPVEDSTVDLVVAGQAFHWFDLDASRREFSRVLKPQGWVVLIWNDRVSSGSRFAEQYEQLLVRFGTDYAQVHHRGKTTGENLGRFFGSAGYDHISFPNEQRLTYEQFVARVLSSSYMPGPGHTSHEPMMRELRRIFDENQRASSVTIAYNTIVFSGRLT